MHPAADTERLGSPRNLTAHSVRHRQRHEIVNLAASPQVGALPFEESNGDVGHHPEPAAARCAANDWISISPDKQNALAVVVSLPFVDQTRGGDGDAGSEPPRGMHQLAEIRAIQADAAEIVLKKAAPFCARC